MTQKGPGAVEVEVKASRLVLWPDRVARLLVEDREGEAESEPALLEEASLEVIPGLQPLSDAGQLEKEVLALRKQFVRFAIEQLAIFREADGRLEHGLGERSLGTDLLAAQHLLAAVEATADER